MITHDHTLLVYVFELCWSWDWMGNYRAGSALCGRWSVATARPFLAIQLMDHLKFIHLGSCFLSTFSVSLWHHIDFLRDVSPSDLRFRRCWGVFQVFFTKSWCNCSLRCAVDQGITEFLGVGSEQRTCALRAGPDGARVRFVQRQALTELPGKPSCAVRAFLHFELMYWRWGSIDV